jgi:hypothetical protein
LSRFGFITGVVTTRRFTGRSNAVGLAFVWAKNVLFRQAVQHALEPSRLTVGVLFCRCGARLSADVGQN